MTLEEVRKGIDSVDNQMKELFRQRMALADNVATVKAQTADSIFKPEREELIIKRVTEDMDESIVKEYTAFIKRTMEVSRKYQYRKTLELRNCFPFEITSDASEESAAFLVLPEHQHLKFSFKCIDKSGTFATALTMIADYGVNVTDLQVVSVETEEGKMYELTVDVEANLLEKEIQAMVFQLSEENKDFALLLSY